MEHVIVVGGGIAGLSAAYYARKKTPDVKITVLESGPCWGGKISTERIPFAGGQFVIEAGADSFLASKPHALTLCRELGLGERLHPTIPNKRSTYILHNGRLCPLPGGLSMMIPTDLGSIVASPLLSWPQKVRMGLDLFLPSRPAGGDESLGAFVSRRLGRGAYENLIEPLMSGIYAGDGDQLSLTATFPALRGLEREFGSLVRGALALKRRSSQPVQGSRSAFLTPTGGLAEIVEGLVSHLSQNNANLRLNTRAAAITRPTLHSAPDTWHVTLDTGEALQADSVILAAPAYVSAALLASLDPALAADLDAIPYASTATVSLAYKLADLPRALDGYGYVIPRREGRRALACTWTSTKFPHRAPEGYALLRVFIGRAGAPPVIPPFSSRKIPAFSWANWDENGGTEGGEGDLLAIAREELSLTLGITAEPVLSRVFMWERAMPQYNLGHPERLARIDAALEKHPGLALAGNGYRGIGIPDCIRSGELAAGKALE